MMNVTTTAVQHHAEQLAALGNPLRLAALRLLVQGPSTGTPVGDMQARLDVPWSTLNHHLNRLTEAGLIAARPEGRFIYYRADYAALRALTSYLWQDCCRAGAKECC